jgi:hypothetical protein
MCMRSVLREAQEFAHCKYFKCCFISHHDYCAMFIFNKTSSLEHSFIVSNGVIHRGARLCKRRCSQQAATFNFPEKTTLYKMCIFFTFFATESSERQASVSRSTQCQNFDYFSNEPNICLIQYVSLSLWNRVRLPFLLLYLCLLLLVLIFGCGTL